MTRKILNRIAICVIPVCGISSIFWLVAALRWDSTAFNYASVGLVFSGIIGATALAWIVSEDL